MGWLPAHKLYEWDLDAAIESGLVVKADTVEELCEKLGIAYVDRAVETINRWNTYCLLSTSRCRVGRSAGMR